MLLGYNPFPSQTPNHEAGTCASFQSQPRFLPKRYKSTRHHFHEGIPHLVFCFVLRSQSESISEMIDVELTGCQ